MADKKITQLVDGGAPQATDEFVIARGGDNFKVDYASLESETLNDAVILAPASSARNVIVPTTGAVLSALSAQLKPGDGNPSDPFGVGFDPALTAAIFGSMRRTATANSGDIDAGIASFVQVLDAFKREQVAALWSFAQWQGTYVGNHPGGDNAFHTVSGLVSTATDIDWNFTAASPSHYNHLRGVEADAIRGGSGVANDVTGIYAEASVLGDTFPTLGATDRVVGGHFECFTYGAPGNGTITELTLLRLLNFYTGRPNPAITNAYGLKVHTNLGAAGVGNSYGIHLAAQSGADTLSYAIFAAGGKSVLVDGVFIRLLAAPADATFANGEGGWWWDQANSLPKWKGKTSGGVVVNFTPAAEGSGAPTTATYITQTPDAGLSAEQALSALATGIVKNTTATGVLSIAAQGTDYYAPGGTDVAVADGGTGASTASAARTNLGLVIGTDVASQASDDAKVAKSLYDANTVLAATTDDTPAAVTMAASTILARLASGNIKAASVAEVIALLAPLSRAPGYVTGQYYLACSDAVGGGLAGTGAPTVSRAIYTPFYVYTTKTFDRIAIYITANAGAGGLHRLGIYNDNAGIPGTVLLDAGTVATDAGAPAIKAITISQQLAPGRYWAVSVAQTAAATVRRILQFSPSVYLTADFQDTAFYTDSVTGALGNNPTVSSAGISVPLVALRA